jgi:hypothetical protein
MIGEEEASSRPCGPAWSPAPGVSRPMPTDASAHLNLLLRKIIGTTTTSNVRAQAVWTMRYNVNDHFAVVYQAMRTPCSSSHLHHATHGRGAFRGPWHESDRPLHSAYPHNSPPTTPSDWTSGAIPPVPGGEAGFCAGPARCSVQREVVGGRVRCAHHDVRRGNWRRAPRGRGRKPARGRPEAQGSPDPPEGPVSLKIVNVRS